MKLQDVITSCEEIAEPIIENAKTQNWETLFESAKSYTAISKRKSLESMNGYDFEQLVNNGVYVELTDSMKNQLAFESFYYDWLGVEMCNIALNQNYTKSNFIPS